MSILYKTLTAAILFSAAFSVSAQAQMASQPWTFTPQNRASIAALMKQTEEGSTAAAAVSSDNIVCGGGGGQSSATANSTCIILNKATGQIQIGQDSNGSQDSISLTPDTPEEGTGTADEVLAAMAGNPAE